jgi:Flp pilus assembly protein TadG
LRKRLELWKCKRGTAAVEFALVAIPFFMLLFAILEASIIYFASITLENGMYEVARLIRTGQIAPGEDAAKQFKEALCGEVNALLSCEDNLYIDVRAFSQFGGSQIPSPIVDGEFTDNTQFNPGQAGDVVLVRAYYLWDLKTPLFGPLMANVEGGKRLLGASAAFRNEPYGSILPSS